MHEQHKTAQPTHRDARVSLHAKCILAVIGYFAFHVFYRTALGGALGLDDAEMILDAQSIRLGYGPQLPLYAWLQHLVFAVTGPTLFGLALLKNTVLCGTVLTVFLLLRSAVQTPQAALATASLLLVPQLAWESQRALTHSVLVTCSAAAFVAALWRVAKAPGLGRFVVLALTLTMGGLAKYNFALVPPALLLAASSFAQYRPTVFQKGLLLAFAGSALLLSAPYIWILQTPELAFASAHKFNIAADAAAQTTPLSGLSAVARATGSFVALPLLVAVILFLAFRDKTATPAPSHDLERLLRRMMLIALVLLCAGAMLAGVTEIRDRWLQPVLLFFAPALILWLAPRLKPRGVRALRGTCLALAGLIVIALPVHYFKPGADVAARFDLLVPRIVQSLPADTTYFAPQFIAGNVFYVAPDLPIAKINAQSVLPQDKPAALIWQGRDEAMGRAILATEFIDGRAWQLQDVQIFEAPYRFDADGTPFVLSVARIVRN